jgi:hypothetical protein
MTISFSPNNAAVVATPADLIYSALLEGGIIAAGEKLQAQDAAWGLEKLQRVLDQTNARREMIYSHSFLLFNLQANHSPHTIGPNGDFNLPIRPVKIISAAFLLNSGGGQPVDSPFLNIRDDDWWAQNPLKSLTSSVVTDLYYDAASPLGNCNFFPICQGANPVRLEIWASLAQAVALQTKLGFVQGYWDWIVTDLAVKLCPSYNRQVPADLREQWNRASRIVQANNDGPPQISTNGGGMPSSRRGGRPDFNFLTGMRE